MPDRREFLRQIGGATAAGMLLPVPSAVQILVRANDIKFGCAAITWGGNDGRAIDDISALGYAGIQLRTSVLKAYADRPSALRDLLGERHLTFVALSSGNVPIDPATHEKVVEEHLAHARFLRAAGGLYLQLIDERPKGRAVEAGDYAQLGKLLTEIGKRVADLGVQAAYHPHMGSIGETPDAIDRVLDATDPKHVRLLFDVAHYQAGGGDPVRAIHRYANRIGLLHIKDLRQAAGSARYQFVELGRGSVNLPGVFDALREERFDGWAIVELDSVPEPDLSPKEAAAISKQYLEETIGVRIS
jgi:inosose dehydratase